jgi:hypothetical protein
LPLGWGCRFSGPNSSRQITIASPVSAAAELNDPVTLGHEIRVGGALPRSHGLKPDVLLAKELTQAFVGDVRDHPLGNQVVREFGQTYSMSPYGIVDTTEGMKPGTSPSISIQE